MQIDVNLTEVVGDSGEAVDFVQDLDQYMGDWDFTLDTLAYFLGQYYTYLDECVKWNETPQYIPGIDPDYRPPT